MRLVRVSSLGLAVAAALLGGCATAAAGQGSKTKRVCIDRREINSLKGLDDQHALVRRSSGRYSLLTMDKKCRGLKLARTVLIEGSAARVCGEGVSLLSFDYPAVGPMRCRVEQIEAVPDESAALELIESRAPRE